MTPHLYIHLLLQVLNCFSVIIKKCVATDDLLLCLLKGYLSIVTANVICEQ